MDLATLKAIEYSLRECLEAYTLTYSSGKIGENFTGGICNYIYNEKIKSGKYTLDQRVMWKEVIDYVTKRMKDVGIHELLSLPRHIHEMNFISLPICFIRRYYPKVTDEEIHELSMKLCIEPRIRFLHYCIHICKKQIYELETTPNITDLDDQYKLPGTNT